MKKPVIQEGASETEGQEPRELNMEEKRKLEKLLLSDIDTAVARYNEQAEGDAPKPPRQADEEPAGRG